jgi:putative ABC transport system substrate-binding protein
MGGKWFELLKQTAPEVTHVSVVFNPDTATYAKLFLPTMEAAAHSLAVPLTVSPIQDSAGIERAFASVASEPNGGLVLLPDALPGRSASRWWRWRPAIACPRSTSTATSQERAA